MPLKQFVRDVASDRFAPPAPVESLNDVIDSDAAPPVRDLAVLRAQRRLVAQMAQDARDDLRRTADAFEATCEDDEEVLQFARAELLRAAGVLDAQ